MKRQISFGLIAALLFFSGCDNDQLVAPKTAEPPKPVELPGASSEVAAVPATPAGEAQKAAVGVGIRGDSLRNEEGIGEMIAAPAVALFNTRERVVFEIQIPQALQLFQALEGRLPKSHDEFMSKIVKANSIQLPELKPGMKYNFRPDVGELWVEPIKSGE